MRDHRESIRTASQQPRPVKANMSAQGAGVASGRANHGVMEMWTRLLSRLGAPAWVLMAPSTEEPNVLEKALSHPASIGVDPGWLGADVPLSANVIVLEQEARRGAKWAQDLYVIGYRSAVQCCFGMLGGHSCRLWMLGTREFSVETAAVIAWNAHCEWPKIRLLLFELRTSLTEREVECLRYAAMGKSQAQIAEAMSCSARTVRFHLENSMAKLGAESSSVAIQRALLLGLS